MLNILDYVRAMFGLYWDHVYPNFTPRPARALKYWRLSQYGLMNISMECLLFGTMSGPSLDHVGTMLGPASIPDQLGL